MYEGAPEVLIMFFHLFTLARARSLSFLLGISEGLIMFTHQFSADEPIKTVRSLGSWVSRVTRVIRV